MQTSTSFVAEFLDILQLRMQSKTSFVTEVLDTPRRSLTTSTSFVTEVLEQFGEGDLYASWAEFLCKGGLAQEMAIQQVSRVAGLSLSLLGRSRRESSIEPSSSQGVEEALPVPPALPEVERVRHSEVDLPLGTFVASIQRKTKFSRLHRIGNCPLLPGRDYA